MQFSIFRSKGISACSMVCICIRFSIRVPWYLIVLKNVFNSRKMSLAFTLAVNTSKTLCKISNDLMFYMADILKADTEWNFQFINRMAIKFVACNTIISKYISRLLSHFLKKKIFAKRNAKYYFLYQLRPN